MPLANKGIRDAIKRSHRFKWEIADQIGIHDTTFSIWLRHPLSAERKQRVLDAIAELAKQPND